MANPRYVTIGKFEELSGYTEDATRSKIARGDWVQDREFIKAPDGRVLVDLVGYEKWAEGQSEPACARLQKARSRSTSTTAASAAGSG